MSTSGGFQGISKVRWRISNPTAVQLDCGHLLMQGTVEWRHLGAMQQAYFLSDKKIIEKK